MKRVVCDTNIVISGRLWSGAPRQVLQLAEQDKIHLIASEVMLDELRDVLSRPKFAERLNLIAKTAEQVVTEYLLIAQAVEPAAIRPVIISDPDDDAILACAVGGAADYIVSGDKDLLALTAYENIPILSADQFLERFSTEAAD